MRNNIGFPNKNVNMSGVDTAFNSWDLNLTPAANDFLSVTDPSMTVKDASAETSGALGPRQADGNLPKVDFLRLAAGSQMIDKGKDVGLTFVGKAPDLGAYEFGAKTGAGGAGGTTVTGTAATGGTIASGGAGGGTTVSAGGSGNRGNVSVGIGGTIAGTRAIAAGGMAVVPTTTGGSSNANSETKGAVGAAGGQYVSALSSATPSSGCSCTIRGTSGRDWDGIFVAMFAVFGLVLRRRQFFALGIREIPRFDSHVERQ
jgi:hypothetical protein